jgi:curli production assembly/transport component CsgF
MSAGLWIASASAGPLIYTPRNPDFGGSPFNGSVLLGEANAQNKFTSSSKGTAATGSTASQQFASELQSTLLSYVAQNIASDILGPNRLPSGTFLVGTTQVTFNTSGSEINITITDTGTGASTTIQVPVPTSSS